MAISPEEARKLTEEELSYIKELEVIIDSYIRKNYNDGAIDVPITVEDANQLGKQRVKNELISRYKNVGWKTVEFKDISKSFVLRLNVYEANCFVR